MKRAAMPPRRAPLAAVSPRRRRRLRAYTGVRRVVAERAEGLCEARATRACEGVGSDVHHVILRSAGGDDEPANLLWVCRPCHRWAHANPWEAHALGLIRRGWDPVPPGVALAVPVALADASGGPMVGAGGVGHSARRAA